MIIYWSYLSPTPSHSAFSMLWEEPTPLISHLKDEYGSLIKDSPDLNFLRCPVVLNEIKNTFIIKSPIDYSLMWDGERVYSREFSENFFNDIVEVGSVKHGFAALKYFPIFFAENSVSLSMTPPYMSQTSFAKNTTQISGTFDCSNWFRSLDVEIKFKEKNVPAILKRGDPFLYVKFHTDEKIEFKKFYFTEELYELAGTGVQVRSFANISKVEYLYDIFKKSKRRSRILKLIKDNLETD